MNKKNNVERFCLNKDASILDALQVINQGGERICFLVDSQKRLIRVISDGDIRRALLKGHTLKDRVLGIHNRKPCVVTENQNLEAARNYLSRRITIVPIINYKGQVKGVLRFQDVENLINIRSREILVVGMGFVGLTLALVLADVGFSVYAFDANQDLMHQIKKKKSPFHEKGIENYLVKHVGNNLRPVSSLGGLSADIYILCVGTPIDKKRLKPNTTHLKEAIRAVAKMLKKNDLVILRSTVPVGLTRKVALPLLEKESGLKVGDDFFLAYCPERTSEGRALEELRKIPQIIGGYDLRSTELASRLFNENTHTVIDVGSLEAAEMCKLLDNTFRDTIFAYSNQMAILCERLGLNLVELIEKINLGYHRNWIPRPSPGVGGACLSKDPYMIMQNFKEHGLDCSLIREARKINEIAPKTIYQKSRDLLRKVDKDFKQGKIFIIGFAFKGEPETSDLRDSTAIWFLNELKRNHVKNIWGYDPVVSFAELKKIGIKPCSIEDGFSGADAVFIMNNHSSYVNLKIFELINTMNHPALFFDGWQIFNPVDIRNIPGILYAGVGIG